ncbi:Hypothetical protein GLP15_564 [Giardia lamblia P15]|uniref:Uncharacterized protein n=1 Tax=Giardia intestinalis (strain P15) TaxID=658858 RepID=E1F210_GIAIA|nr:Hypothetical protein GLP15_564 [Giardia lamblia P15]
MQWHNYAREYTSSQREIKSGSWRDSTPRLLQVLIHSIYFSPRTLRSFSGLGLSIGVKIPRKTATLYSDVISPELVQEETLTESLIEQDQGRKVQITMRSLFSLLYPHSCYRNVSDCKIFLAVVDRKQKINKVYEALLDLDYLLGPGQSYLTVLSPIRAGTSRATYAPLFVITDIGRASSIAQSHAATLALSIRSIYPTQEILSRFPKDLMIKLDKLIDFSPVSKQDLFSRPEKRVIAEKTEPSVSMETLHSVHLKGQIDSGAHSAILPTLSVCTKPHDPELTPASPYLNAPEIALSLPPSLPYSSTPLSYTNIGANPSAALQGTTLRQSSLPSTILQRTQALPLIPKIDAASFTQLLKQEYLSRETTIYLSIVSAFKTKNIERLLFIFGFAPTFVPQDSISAHTVSQYVNFPLDINSVSYSAPLCASMNDTPMLMQQNVRMVLTQTDQHCNTILHLLMQAFPSTMIMADMNPLRLFPSLGTLTIVERSELVTARAKQRTPTQGEDNDSSESNRSSISTESKSAMTLTEVLDYILGTFLDRLSDLLTPVKGKGGSPHDIGLFSYGSNIYGTMGDPTFGACTTSSEAFKLLCELLDIRNNVFFQRTVVFVLFNSELEYPSLIASGLQSDDSILYFPLPYNNNEQSHIEIENTIRFIGLYLAFLYKALHLTNLFSNCKTEDGSFEQFAAFYNGRKGTASTFGEDINLKSPFSEGNQLPQASTDNNPELLEGVRNQKVSLTSVLFNLKNFGRHTFQEELPSHNKYQSIHGITHTANSFSLQNILDELGYGPDPASIEEGGNIYISESGDLNAYKIPAIASVMQKSIHVLLLTSPDDPHSSNICRIFSSYNQNVFPCSNVEELSMFISDKTPLGAVLSKGVKLLRACATLADITLTTLHPIVLYPVPVPSAAHAEVYDEACKDGARATSLSLVTQIVTCIAKGSISDILSTKDALYEKLFGTPAWLAITQCYCSGILSWLCLFTGSMSTQQSTYNTTVLSGNRFQGTPVYGNTAVSLAFGPLNVSTPVQEHLTPTLNSGTTTTIDSPSQTDLTSGITLRFIKTFESVINQAIKTYLRAQSVIPLAAMVAHIEVLPLERILHAPLYLIYPSSEDRNRLQEISRILLSETPSITPPIDALKIDEKRNFSSIKHTNNRSVLSQENYATKDLLLSRHILTEHSTEPKTPKKAHRKDRKRKLDTDKKHRTVTCWGSISIGQYISDSYVEVSNLLDVQLQIVVGGIPIKDSKKGKTLTLKNLCILNTWRTIEIASTNSFLCALKACKCVYNYIYYHFHKQDNTPVPGIEYYASPAGDDYKWYTNPSLAQEDPVVDRNERPHRRSTSVKHSSRFTAQASISTAANQGSVTKKSKPWELKTDISARQIKPTTAVLTESSTVEDCEVSHKDSESQNVKGWRSTFPEEKTQSEVQSCTSISASTTDVHNMAGYPGTSTVPEATLLQHLESNGGTFENRPSLTPAQGATSSTRTPKSKRLNIQLSIRRSNTRITRETRQRANSTTCSGHSKANSNTGFVAAHSPEQPSQMPISDEYIQEQYLHTFIGIKTKTSDILLRPEVSLQPYVRLSSANINSNFEETLKYIPSELVKKWMPPVTSKTACDCLQRDIRITSKKPLVVQLDQLSEPIVAQTVTIKKSTNDVILFGVFSYLFSN